MQTGEDEKEEFILPLLYSGDRQDPGKESGMKKLNMKKHTDFL